MRLGFDCWRLFYRILWFPLIGPHTFSMPSCVSPVYSGVVYVIVYIMCPHKRHCQLNRWKAELLIPSHLSPHPTLNLILLRSLIFMSSDFHSPRCSGQKLGSHLDASLWGPCIYCGCRPCQTSPPNIPITWILSYHLQACFPGPSHHFLHGFWLHVCPPPVHSPLKRESEPFKMYIRLCHSSAQKPPRIFRLAQNRG